MTGADTFSWKKNDFSINRAPGPLSEQQKTRADETLLEASDLISSGKKRKQVRK